MWAPLKVENKIINESLLVSASIKFFFNPMVDITFFREELKPTIGKQGKSQLEYFRSMKGELHVYNWYDLAPCGQPYVITTNFNNFSYFSLYIFLIIKLQEVSWSYWINTKILEVPDIFWRLEIARNMTCEVAIYYIMHL